MKLEEFAKDAGCVVSIKTNSSEWGGKYQYHTTDSPNIHVCGYKTEAAAYKGWMNDTFGSTTAKAITKLLKKAK